MKKKSLIFLVVLVVLISTFSVFAIGMVGHSENGTCPISMGSDCSYMNNALAVVDHHISSMQVFAEGMTTSDIGIILVLLSVALILLFIKPANAIDNLTINFRYIYIRYTAHPIFMRILKWIAFRNRLEYSYAKVSNNPRS